MLRIVLADSVTRDDVDDAIVAHRWRLADVVAASAAHPAQLVLLTEDRGAAMHFVDDQQVDARYFVVSGRDAARARRELEATLPTVDDAAITLLLSSPDRPSELARGLVYAALSSESKAGERVSAFERAASHADESVRAAVVVAAAYARWSELRPLVERCATSDPSPALRARATIVLNGFSR